MYTGFHPLSPSDAELATRALNDESSCRFPHFSANDAVIIGLSLRKRFEASSRYSKGKGLVISVQSIAGHTLFACTVGDLGGVSGVQDVSLDSWSVLESMMAVVKRTGHSSYYVEKGIGAMGKSQSQLGIRNDFQVYGGAFPIWLENAFCCPIGIVACYSGSSHDDHHLVVTGIKDYLKKLKRDTTRSLNTPEQIYPGIPVREPHRVSHSMHSEYQSSEWATTEASQQNERRSSEGEERRRE